MRRHVDGRRRIGRGQQLHASRRRAQLGKTGASQARCTRAWRASRRARRSVMSSSRGRRRRTRCSPRLHRRATRWAPRRSRLPPRARRVSRRAALDGSTDAELTTRSCASLRWASWTPRRRWRAQRHWRRNRRAICAPRRSRCGDYSRGSAPRTMPCSSPPSSRPRLICRGHSRGRPCVSRSGLRLARSSGAGGDVLVVGDQSGRVDTKLSI